MFFISDVPSSSRNLGKRNGEQSRVNAFRHNRIELGIRYDDAALPQFMCVQIDRFLVEGDQNVQIVRNRPDRPRADANFVVRVSPFDP